MAGIMQDQMQQQNPAGTGSLEDPVLKQIEQGIEQSVPPELKQMYTSIVVAGMNVMFSKETSELMDQQFAQSDDVVANVAEGISKLIVMVFNESGQDIKDFAPAAGLAAISLMCQALEYWEATTGGQVTPELAAEATKATMMATLERFGITQDQVGQVIAAGQQQGVQQAPQGAMGG